VPRSIDNSNNRISFTKKALENLPLPADGKRAYFWDTQIRGLSLDVTSKGSKTFYIRRTVNYKRQQVLIGSFPALSIEQARAKALELANQIAMGEDLAERKQLRAKELTLGELFEEYLREHARVKCLAAKEIEAVFRRYLSDWKGRKLSTIRVSEVQARMNYIGRENGQTAANHTLTYAKAAINWCLKNGITKASNPWLSISKFKLNSRKRFLKPEEMKRFFSALQSMSNTEVRDYVLLSLFTGARQANVLSMRWDQIDMELGIWTISRTKSGDSQIVPLTVNAISLLMDRFDAKQSEWVFPGPGKTGHLVEPKKAWYGLLKAAEIPDLRMHDLRRTLGSYMAMGNQSLPTIGEALGHKSPSATQIYSQFANDPVRKAMQKAQNDMFLAAGLKIPKPKRTAKGLSNPS